MNARRQAKRALLSPSSKLNMVLSYIVPARQQAKRALLNARRQAKMALLSPSSKFNMVLSYKMSLSIMQLLSALFKCKISTYLISILEISNQFWDSYLSTHLFNIFVFNS